MAHVTVHIKLSDILLIHCLRGKTLGWPMKESGRNL